MHLSLTTMWGWVKTLVPLVNIKIAGKWMFIPLKMVSIGIDPYPCLDICFKNPFGGWSSEPGTDEKFHWDAVDDPASIDAGILDGAWHDKQKEKVEKNHMAINGGILK
jgi:hypothetical protein